MVGAYQEILGMKHNLFAKPSEVIVTFDKESKNRDYELRDFKSSLNILDILEDIGYDKQEIKRRLNTKIDLISIDLKDEIKKEIDYFLNDNNYLKTTKK